MEMEKWLKDGIVPVIPRKREDKKALFSYIAKEEFETGRDYSEKEINEGLLKYHLDCALVRRFMIEYKILTRDRSGTKYQYCY